MKKIKQRIFRSDRFETLEKKVKNLASKQPLLLQGVAGSLLAFVTASVFERHDAQVVAVAPDDDSAEKLRDDCTLLLGEENVRFFGTLPHHQAQMLDMSTPIARTETLRSLAAGASVVVVASPESVAESVPPRESFCRMIIELKAGEEKPFQDFIRRLIENGFEQKDFVEGYGDVAVRGGIIDVFPFIGENPIRIEFFGDTIESIREFDVLSQRSIRQLPSASIVPALSADAVDDAELPRGPGVADEVKRISASLFDYLSPEAIIILNDPALIEAEINELVHEGVQDLFDWKYIDGQSRAFRRIVNSPFHRQQSTVEDEISTSLIDFASAPQPAFNGNIHVLVDSLKKLALDGYTIHLASDTKEEGARLKELVEEVLTSPEDSYPVSGVGTRIASVREDEHELPVPNLRTDVEQAEPSAVTFELLSETVHAGFIFPPARLAVFTEHEIFGRLKRRGTGKRRRFKGFTQKELQQLRPGDCVVHVDHGIGTFAGLAKLKVGGMDQEVMKLLFLENDVLYVNLSFVNRVQKYSSQEGHIPKLSKLGGDEWERMKARAKRRIKDIARDLIALYARRKHERGFAFSPDTHWQRELEASFMYEDTPDQAQATSDAKRDMESASPMDRLICGDVGFGKTEVAVRAAFKAVMDGKQVAVLVPTTILAMQHYNTFQDRLARYTVRIESIMRFKSAKEQKKIVQQLEAGGIDIIIGTHRLLSKDIALKDLGLLIIDEEHRFGVAAKEKLRKLKASVDTLTLTATPIPRTLHFSLVGARDLSLISTPPRNRLPIATEIVSADFTDKRGHWQFIREAILKELHRGGQAYFVHDRVNNIDAIAQQVQSHVPEARVDIAHGQMHGHQLEKVMFDFLEKKRDVLVCTKIIESGIDIPSVNTIIVNRADRFGLAELYQLRGRVGRSNVQAYAYLLTPPLGLLPRPALRRLQAIEEFTELGSGFNLAMRDLEIRGAGNLLGAEQSGFIMEMGFEMYERVVREAVEELKQEEFKEVFQKDTVKFPIRDLKFAEAVIESDIEALIPDFYVESDSERLDIYRRLYRAVSEEELVSMRGELHDRFGEYPEEVEHLFILVELRMSASRAGFKKISLKGKQLSITLPDASDERFYGSPTGSETAEDGDKTAPFQQLMKKIGNGEIKNVHLKQVGKELTLQFTHVLPDGTKERLEDAKKKLQEVMTWSFLSG
jgi:transcription-repair coupling factor (superfamily II helicase)